ncbi:MAE_28990/MAE_18760 family HEPN-like nuclease [Cognatiluteimonas profundi]|uniref:MAE_28990/MAE_18760 family HEPN-like nuclease n=1 Tax=Cognatiluteimonas profundi TaxID=2594501 RepID=UPI00131AE037|nr:MAE_28990/MAE_18760 family HEPN-like nuclease [Lysobacter profundi]
MLSVQSDADRRFAEVGLFIKFLKELDKAPRKTGERFPSARPSSPILKACTFLLLYNVIESCVRSALGQTYEEILNDGMRYTATTQKIRDLWLKQQLDVSADSANHQTYITLATKVAGAISDGDVIRLDSRKLPISGNLDSDAVRVLCAKHGVNLKVAKWAKGGVEMTTIKDQRNALAHGLKSFSECGRDYAVKDLERIYKQTQHFLNGFVRSVGKFNAEHRYKQR